MIPIPTTPNTTKPVPSRGSPVEEPWAEHLWQQQAKGQTGYRDLIGFNKGQLFGTTRTVLRQHG